MQTTTTSIPRATPTQPISVDALTRKSFAELEAMFRRASTPASLHDAEGVLRGRMLAMRGADRGPIARWLRRYAASPGFLWQGKTFAAGDGQRGDGFNRVAFGPILGRQNIFPFELRFGRSSFDGNRTMIVDYDRPANPPYMRRTYDEIRELEPRLYLGIDIWKTARSSVGLVWFTLDGRSN
jgi:hypothetical protein